MRLKIYFLVSSIEGMKLNQFKSEFLFVGRLPLFFKDIPCYLNNWYAREIFRAVVRVYCHKVTQFSG